MRHIISLLPLLLIGCAPQDATITGTYTTWLAASSSGTVDEGALTLSDATKFNCTGLDVLGFEQSTCSKPDDPGWFDPQFFTWVDDDAYYVMSGALEPWRSEVVVTSEGGLQLTFHMDLGDGEDFRVAWVIDPDFEPTVCTQAEDGSTSLEQQDGADWVEKWSDDESGTIYYLNAGSYQLNPYDSLDYWPLPSRWISGYGYAKYAAEEFNARPSDFGMYQAGGTESWYIELDPDAPDMAAYEALYDDVKSSVEGWVPELAGGTGTAATELGYADAAFQMKVENYNWRPVDQSSAGLDSWVQADTSWVIFDSDPKDILPGDSTSGSFHILLKGSESGSYSLVVGDFDVPAVREDRWGYTDLLADKQEENETPTCGG